MTLRARAGRPPGVTAARSFAPRAGASAQSSRPLSAVTVDQCRDLVVAHHALRELRRLEDALAECTIGRVIAVLLEPAFHVRDSRHRRDVDALPESEVARWHAGVDPVGKPRIALLARLD